MVVATMAQPQIDSPLSSPKYLRALLDQCSDMVFVVDRPGRLVDCNESARRRLGAERSGLLGRPFREIEIGQPLTNELKRSFQDGSRRSGPAILRCQDGSSLSVTFHVVPLDLDESKVLCLLARPDQTVRAEEDLTSSQVLDLSVFREVFQRSSDAIAVIDAQGRYLFQNPAHLELLGFSDEDLEDHTPAIHLGASTFAKIGEALAKNGSYVGEHVARTKSGVSRAIELSAFAVAGREGGPPMFVGIKRDLGEVQRRRREQVEREYEELRESLRHAQKMELIGQLAAGVAHDFNNLLTPILSNAELQLHGRDADDATREAFQEIYVAAERGRSLTKQLLAFARKQLLSLQQLDLRELVLSTTPMLRGLLVNSPRVELDLDLEHALPTVKADPAQFQQVLMNLVANARDAMPGGGRISIRLHEVSVAEGDERLRVLGEPGRYICLAVSDTGCGMDGETLARVFEPFFTRRGNGNGTGLGLSIVYGIVRQHGGCVQPTSELGRGSTFRVYLPSSGEVRSAEVSTGEEDDAGQQDATGECALGETVLVVEDEAPVRSLVVRILEMQGYRVLRASSGEDALAEARRHRGPVHLLLSDVVMPGMSGPELFRRLREEQPEVRALFMSGYARDALGSGGRVDDTVHWIEKPFTGSELSVEVRRVLRSSEETP